MSDDEYPMEVKVNSGKCLFPGVGKVSTKKTSRGMIPCAFTASKNYKMTDGQNKSDYDPILKLFEDRAWVIDEYHFENSPKTRRLHMHGIVYVEQDSEVSRKEYWELKGFYITRKRIYNQNGWECYIRKDI